MVIKVVMVIKRTIYLVQGSQGRGDDFEAWPVVAYANFEEANRHAAAAKANADRMLAADRRVDGLEDPVERPNPYDKSRSSYDYGACYWVTKLDLLETA